jgi:hypothetical protein
MKNRSASRTANLALLLVAVAISLGIVVSGIQASHARNFLLIINLFFWLMFVVTYPLAVVQSGIVTGTEPGSVSYRSTAPSRFWTGLVATTLFWAALFLVIALYSFMAWYRAA